MSSVNVYTREITIKMVYYGPGLGGKTTTLQAIHNGLPPAQRGQLVSLATRIDRTLYFDFLPVNLPKIRDYTIRLSLYTVPGQVHYNATRKLVLTGCDGVVFVADSQIVRHEANIESLQNLEENLRAHGLNPDNVPLVLQYNKRDLGSIATIDELNSTLNQRGVPSYETSAISGQGVSQALKTIIRLVLEDLKNKGVFRERASSVVAPLSSSTPTVSSSVAEGLVGAFEARLERGEPRDKGDNAPAQQRGLTLSDLWAPGAAREQVIALEGDIERGELNIGMKRIEGLLREQVGNSGENWESIAEAMLMLGVSPEHYARFRRLLEQDEISKQDVLFGLFFLTDVELRMQSAGLRPAT